MRKLTATLITLMMLFTIAIAEGTAESAFVEYDFGDFYLSMPEDIACQYTEEKVDGQSFLYLYQDYDPNSNLNKNLNISWSSEVLDITSAEPEMYLEYTLANITDSFAQAGIIAANPTAITSELATQDGKETLGMVYSVDVDYSQLGIDLQTTMYFVQSITPDENFGTYTFTVTTNSIEDTQLLYDIADSVRWK